MGQEVSDVPTMINYQGFLADQNGTPLNGSYQITFALYSEPTGAASIVWDETHDAVDVENGLFNVLLGSLDTLNAEDFQGDRYLGIRVAGEAEMTPRMRLASTAYSLRAEEANKLTGSIESGMFNVTQIYNSRTGPLPLDTTFVSGGGTILVFASGSGYVSTAGQIGMVIRLDDEIRGYATVFTNIANDHRAITTNLLVLTGVPEGEHTLRLENLGSTKTDRNDFFYLTILELPF
jgi:hypothetical protein